MIIFCTFVFLASTLQGYIVVQRSPPIVKGPYSDLQFAKNELKEIAKNGKSRMMLEIIDGAIQVEWDQVHNINGVYQSPENGFDRYNQNWDDILGMIEIAKQHLIFHKKNLSGKNTNHPMYHFTTFQILTWDHCMFSREYTFKSKV